MVTATAEHDLAPTRLADDDLAAMLFIRHFERQLLELFEAGQLNGTTHTCLGQEYIPVALSALLKPHDWVVSNHRGHGHYLARYDDPHGLLAEIMGRSGGLSSGVGGSQHLYRRGFVSSGVQGQSLPIAVGLALHAGKAGTRDLVLTFTGDGTWGEGAVYEALNMASLWQVPLLVAVENNGIAQTTPLSRHLAGTIAGRAAAFDIAYEYVDSTDVNLIRRRLRPAVARMRERPAPLIVEFRTERLGPHSKGDDVRPGDAIDRAQARDWYLGYAEHYPHQLGSLDAAARERARTVVRAVAEWPLARWDVG